MRSSIQKLCISTSKSLASPPPPPSQQYPLQCVINSTAQSCPHNYPTNYASTNLGHPATCPDYFRWIHEDLRPWKETGVTKQMVEAGRKTANFKLVILEGRVYVEKYRDSIQTRDEFTLWGILQLLRRYPGRLPDLELMFDCGDRPVIPANNFKKPYSGPPPLFKYCSDPWSLDIVFPDWSFWGWAECNIKPWRNTSIEIQEGSKMMKWKDRIPLAYWRGNPKVAPWRADLLKCNATNTTDWSVRIYSQNWEKQAKVGFKESNLKDQCTHRYKIYIEGWAWSVSEKYILGCDSMTLVVKPTYHDFFNRGMLPLVHYWPIKNNDKCKSLKFAVEWGNSHVDKAHAIGQAASRYIHEDMKMDYVYDYMFHLLNEYAKLLRFKPSIPPKAIELCSEAMACAAKGNWRKFMEESLEKSPSNGIPCSMPPPYDPLAFRSFLEKKANLTRQVEIWEDEYWENLNPKRKP
ncbi:protein O-glucosyltransferase 1-like [Chenopodium quinoa]|uniref:Glycosyl transferase CAP10 domain-containing protein n=1 Tax=Chenopodium quinoa TaxID=63459 RepID=A0A803MPZ7_CHEQI|nr:protein O-glucosyltransferase 1-like [Chenopodium quinoa]